MYYEVSGSRLRILGTYHLSPVDRSLPAFVTDAAQWADAGCMEHNPQEFAPLMRLNDGARLEDLLPPDLWTAVKAAWEKEPKIPAVLQKHRPWAALIMLGVARLRFGPGAETVLGASLEKKGQTFGYIERAGDVAALFDSVPLPDVVEVIRQALPKLGRSQEQFEGMYDRWAARDAAGLQAHVELTPMFGNQVIRDSLLLSRNRAWVESVVKAGKPASNTVLAVGAMHLVGPGNFIDLLRERAVPVREL
ncbi:TraB/GumN family protein [Variovorax sp. CCNWLW235]|uniref:TraB/GumN family protein n=1 Tax=Variovorax sp. CCNWLW235 TaxID=3127463 RepID=UPI0030782D6D